MGAKKKQLVEHQGVVPGTPETSDDDDEDDVHESTFCAVQQQENSWMVSPNKVINQNFYQNEPAPQLLVPHKLITNVNPHEKSRSSKGRGVSPQQEHIRIPQFWKKDDQIMAIEQVSTRPVKLNA